MRPSPCSSLTRYKDGGLHATEGLTLESCSGRRLPRTILAFFYMSDASASIGRRMHANFLAEYPSLSAIDVPLLRLDLAARRPFSPG